MWLNNFGFLCSGFNAKFTWKHHKTQSGFIGEGYRYVGFKISILNLELRTKSARKACFAFALWSEVCFDLALKNQSSLH